MVTRLNIGEAGPHFACDICHCLYPLLWQAEACEIRHSKERVADVMADTQEETLARVGGCVPSVDSTLAERGARYGDFTDHAAISQDIQDLMRATAGWARCDAGKRQALTVIADKIARILNGDPEYRDNWYDIQGYAKLAEDRCA